MKMANFRTTSITLLSQVYLRRVRFHIRSYLTYIDVITVKKKPPRCTFHKLPCTRRGTMCTLERTADLAELRV